jgi:hypothetical protein
MERRPLDGNARSLKPDTQLGENVVNEALIARVVGQPVHDVAVRMRGDRIDFWRRVHILFPSMTWVDGTGYVVSRSTVSTERAAICVRASDCLWVAVCPAREDATVVCTENSIRVDDVTESPKLGE